MTDDIVEKHYDAYPFPQILDDKIRERAVKFGKNPLADRSGGARVLDVGCGTGTFANTYASFNPNAVIDAINISQASLDWGAAQAKRMGLKNVSYEHKSLFDLKVNKKEGRYDLVVCHGVLHHTAHPYRGIRIISDLVKPGRLLSLSLYHYGRWPIRWKRALLAMRYGTKRGAERLAAAKRWFPKTCRAHIEKSDPDMNPEAQDAAIADMFVTPIEKYTGYFPISMFLFFNGFRIEQRSGNSGRSVEILSKVLPRDAVLDLKGIVLRQRQFHIIARKDAH